MERELRAARLKLVDPTLGYDRATTLVQASDRFRAGRSEDEVQAELDALLQADIEEVVLQAWFEANRALFGDRTYERSRNAVLELVRLERALQAIDDATRP